jgi:acetyl esterase/lipase
MTRGVTAMIDTEDAQVAGRGGPIRARIYRRPDTAPGAPGYQLVHGGGFAVAGVNLCDHVCRELARSFAH